MVRDSNNIEVAEELKAVYRRYSMANGEEEDFAALESDAADCIAR